MLCHRYQARLNASQAFGAALCHRYREAVSAAQVSGANAMPQVPGQACAGVRGKCHVIGLETGVVWQPVEGGLGYAPNHPNVGGNLSATGPLRVEPGASRGRGEFEPVPWQSWDPFKNQMQR